MMIDSQGPKSKHKPVPPTGVELIDRLVDLPDAECTVESYVSAVSEYVRRSRSLAAGPKKAGQIRLSTALGRALVIELRRQLPELRHAVFGERKVSGALRTVNADVSESHPLDGLRLAVELKPVNLAVGRAIWNRFGDIRTFAVNLHLKFPFCIVGGVLAIPTYEEVGTKEAQAASEAEEASQDGIAVTPSFEASSEASSSQMTEQGRRSTVHLIERAIARLIRAGGRKTEGDAPHLLEGIAVIVYDPSSGLLDLDLPPPGSGLRWNEFIDAMSAAYKGRFEE
ncbi:MAG TPA: hypothetical protein VMU48_05910 [Terracidiphilus sp.]|nr:hypothetical protein [Terracidiphilus sp.]